ncbi:4Fe-4S dicluster domain-containing protein [Halanaerocella petrolearia]
MKRIYIDRDLCEACKNCVLACMAKNDDTDIDSLDVTDINLQSANVIEQKNRSQQNSPLFCRHCDDPDCVQACMSGALTKDPETGIVDIDQEQCAGCWMCVMSCAYGMVFKDKTRNVAFKCDLCQNEEEPACISQCPTGAIEVIEVKEESA